MTAPRIILELAMPVRLWQRFDYLAGDDSAAQQWQPGIRVLAPFGKRSLVGLLLAVKSDSDIPSGKLKPILEKWDDTPLLSSSLLDLCRWVSDYYQHPLGEVISQAMPKALRKKSEFPVLSDQTWSLLLDEKSPPFELNEEQQRAVSTITQANGYKTFLLDGITGSGKTEVYFQSIEPLLHAGKQILVLVPEIALTPQMVARFEQRFHVPIVLLHSDMTDKKRLQGWLQARNGSAAIIIGTRSAVFTPLLNPGLIILDEEHDLSFKQQTNLRYSARDVAIVRGRLENIPVVLGSATPSLESLYNVKLGKYTHLSLSKRAGEAKPPSVRMINLCGHRLKAGLSAELLAKMREHLDQQGQVLLFLNRRGFANVFMCHQCGWMAKCRRCDVYLTLHLSSHSLHCHHCGVIRKTPSRCENCRHPDLIAVGQGTERIEQAVAEGFPQYQVVRIDSDTTKRRGSIDTLLSAVHEQKAQILIGTQMLAKGHHFPHLTLVAIVDADAGLFSVDFRALERMAQLLVQVGGRAGRTHRSGEVIIQTHHPDHPHLQILLNKGYHRLAEALLVERRNTQLPPFAGLAMVRAEAKDREVAHQFLNNAKIALENLSAIGKIALWGPVPAPLERCAGRYRGQLLLQADKRDLLQEVLRQWVPSIIRIPLANKVRWSVDVDPLEMS